MSFEGLKKVWLKNFETVPQSLENVKNIKTAATAFNVCIDAVLKISGQKLFKLIKEFNLSFDELSNIKNLKLDCPEDVIKGIFKSFSRGIAEEWMSEKKEVYQWMRDNLGYDNLQMGGQGGIVANVLGICGVKKVYAHANSLPKLQAEQFLELDNLLSFDENGDEKPAHKIDRKEDVPLIHWIIEFDKDDSFELDGKSIVCPKSNRFIATYDPLNLNLVKDHNFLKLLKKESMNFIVLSGFHALTSGGDGVRLIKETVPMIEKWKEKSKDGILHLEIASTQDIEVRKAIIDEIAPRVSSIGVNERETIDVLEIIEEDSLARYCDDCVNSVNLFEGLLSIKKHIKCSRIELHMFGLYLIIQDKGFKIDPMASRRGMQLAAVVAASKAALGNLHDENNLLWAHGKEVSDVGLKELEGLAEYIGDADFVRSGIGSFEGFDIVAVPTILVDKPKTLVGMGDTISSVSLIGTF